jgi:hypothetical protein
MLTLSLKSETTEGHSEFGFVSEADFLGKTGKTPITACLTLNMMDFNVDDLFKIGDVVYGG